MKEGYNIICNDDVAEDEIEPLLVFLANLPYPIQCQALEFTMNNFFLSFVSNLESFRAKLENLKAIDKLEEYAFFKREELSQHRIAFDLLKSNDHTPLLALLVQSKTVTDLEAACESLGLELLEVENKRDENFEANCNSKMQLHSFILGDRQHLM